MQIKVIFDKNSFGLWLALKLRHNGTRKWAIWHVIRTSDWDDLSHRVSTFMVPYCCGLWVAPLSLSHSKQRGMPAWNPGSETLLASKSSRGHFLSGYARRNERKRFLPRQNVRVHPTCLPDMRHLKSSKESSLKSFRYLKVFNENFAWLLYKKPYLMFRFEWIIYYSTTEHA